MSEGIAGLAALLGIRDGANRDDVHEVLMTADERHLNPGGFVHGGVIATLIDVAMGRATDVGDDEREHPVTIEMKVNYLAPGDVGPLTAAARVRRRGTQFTVVEAEVTQAETVLAVAIGTYTSV